MATNITSQERTNILKLVAGMFDAAPGAQYLEEFTSAFLALGNDYAALATALGNTSAFKSQYPSSLTVEETANKFLGSLGLANNTEAQDFVQSKLNAGEGIASVVFQALQALVDYAGDDAELQAAQTQLANKAAVAEYYSVTLGASSDQLAALQGVVANVTADPASVEAAKEASNGSNGQTYMLTTGADTFNGTAGNDTFTAAETTAKTWSVGDAIDGGAGNDTFNVTQTAAITAPTGATVKNIETANLLSGTTGNSIDTTSWTGLTALNVTGVTAQTVTAAATTDVTVTGSTATGATAVNGGKNVTVTETGASGGTVNVGATTAAAGTVTVNSTILATDGTTGNAITVKGGTDISITQKGVNAVNTTVTDGAVTVTGTAATKTVTVTADKAATAGATVVGHNNNSVSITDVNAGSATAAGTITSATVSNYTTLGFSGTALTTLNVKGGSGNIIIDNSGLTTPTNKTLGLTVDGLTGGTLDDGDIYTTLNVTGTGTASTLANVTFGGATALNVDGSAAVTLTSVAGLTALTSVTSTNTAGLKLGSAIGTGVTFTGGAGDDAVVLGATTKAITMGAGNDKVTSAGLVGTGGSVDAGDGIDTIVMTFAQADAADADATFNSKFKNFEVLELDASAMGANGAVNLVGINGVNSVTTGAASHVLTLDNFASGGTLKLTSDVGAGSYVANVANALFNPADTFNLNLSKSTVLAAGSVTAAGVETFNITAADANTTTTSAAVKHTVTLDLADATTVNVSGNNGLTITNTSGTKITTFDASGVVANSTATVIDTAANLAVTFTSGNATTTANVSITGGAGDDVLTGNAAKDTIVGGAGNDTINGKAGVDTLTGGAGVDTFVIGDGEAGITGAEKITDFSIALGGDKLDTVATALIANVTAANVTSAVGGAVDVTATVKDGIITLGGADAALVDTIGEIKAIFELLNADTAVREAGAIVLNGQTYVLVDDATVGVGAVTTDIIQLVGVTGAVSLSFTDAANSILLA